MSQRTRLRVLAGAVGLLACLTSLTACGDDGGTAAGASGSKVVTDDKATDDKVTVDAGAAAAVKKVPEDFPSHDIPLVDETVLSATKGAAGGPFAWSVVMQSSRPVDELSREVRKDYASWRSDKGTGASLGDVSILHFANGSYEVGVTIARTGSNVTVTYVVKDVA